ncbi:MAG: TIR domain-containing protein [Betaproteobacteria bacterium]
MNTSTQAVFLSYASQDAEVARRICDALRAAGLDVWFDQSKLRGGEAWDASIRKQIKECALFVPIISANTQAREEGYFRLEWKLAVDRSHLMVDDKEFLLPVVIDAIGDANARVPEKFRDVQWTRLDAGVSVEAFAERARQLIEREVRPSASALVPGARLTQRARGSRWRWVAAGALALGLAGIATWVLLPILNPTQANFPRPAVAVIPFKVTGNAEVDAQIAEALTQDLTSALAQRMSLTEVVPHALVTSQQVNHLDPRRMGRELNATYLVMGEIRRPLGQVEITAQLVETSGARQLWTGRVASQESSATQNQAQLVRRLADRLAAEIASANSQRYAGTPASNASPIELVLHAGAVWARNNTSVVGSRDAQKWYDKALRIDPQYLPALVGQVAALGYELLFDPAVDAKKALREMDELSIRAVNLATTSRTVWETRADVLIRLRRWDAAFEALANAEKLGGIDDYRTDLGAELLNRTGQPQETLRLVERGLALDPPSQEMRGWLMLQQCHAYMALGRYDESILACERNVGTDDWWLPHLYLAAGYALKGDAAKAASERETLLELRPSASVAEYKKFYYSDNSAFIAQVERNLLAGLRKAGIP